MSPSQKALWDYITPILTFIAEQSRDVHPTILLNGDLFTSNCAETVRSLHTFPVGLNVGFMLARGAQVNPSVFATLLPESDNRHRVYRLASKDIIRQILRIAARYDIPYQNAKWVTLGMWDNAQSKKNTSEIRKRKREDEDEDQSIQEELPPVELSKQERIKCREAMSMSKSMQQLLYLSKPHF